MPHASTVPTPEGGANGTNGSGLEERPDQGEQDGEADPARGQVEKELVGDTTPTGPLGAGRRGPPGPWRRGRAG
jgi:hypothetical protein